MTNSTDNSTKPVKRKKVPGPIRFEAVIPFTIIVVAVGLYFTLFFDTHLRKGIEFIGSKVQGAEVNVDDVNTSFLGGSFTLSGLQVTDAEKPSTNVVEIGRINFQFLWDALLRAKFVVNDASIESIQVGTPRAKPGFVIKEEPKEKVEEAAAGGNPLGDVSKMLGGFDPLKDFKNFDVNQLESMKKINQLKTELPQKQKEWEETLKTFPTQQEISALQARIQNIKIGGTNNPLEIQKQIQEIDGVIKETQAKIDSVKNKADALKNDVNKYTLEVGGIDNLVKKDRENLEAKLKLPKLDMQSLAMQLFGPSISSKIQQVQRYVKLAKEHIPPPKSKEERKADRLQAEARMKGKTFQFPKANSYPLFWLKHAGISSKADHSPFGGNVKGDLLDVSSNQAQTGKPTVLNLEGDFPKSDVHGVEAHFSLDHRTETPIVDINAKVSNFGVKEKELSNTNDLKLLVVDSKARIDMKGQVRGDKINLNILSDFDPVNYQTSAGSKDIEGIIKGALNDVKKFNVQAQVNGELTSPAIDIRSNLAAALEAAFGKQIKGKIDEARGKLQAMINDAINKPKAELEGQLNGAKSKVTGQLDEKQKQVSQIKDQATKKMNDSKNSAAKSVVPQNMDDLKKKLGF